MKNKYNMTPQNVSPVHTENRTIRTELPVRESLEYFEKLMASEPRSMMGQPPILIDHAEGFKVYDRWGNCWIDWSSGVLIMNAGHGRPEIRDALRELVDKPLLSSYVFAHEKRAELTDLLRKASPSPEDFLVFLLSTGSEAVENAIKIAKQYALSHYGPEKKWVVSFTYGFHGRTMGSQLAGGNDGQKEWIGDYKQYPFLQVPFPDGYKNEDTSFDLFLKTIEERGLQADQIAAVITESYQGVGPDFLPDEYAGQLSEYCRRNNITLIFDEVQAGFGRTGSFWGFEQYEIVPDIIVCGKGISSSLPLAAVIGRKELMNMYPPGSMTSTHSGSPLPAAAAIENIKIIQKENLAQRAKELEPVLYEGLKKIQQRYPERLGCLHARGLVAGIQVVKSGTKTPDPETALAINEKAFQRGVLMFAPVGIAGECLKISPPLVISREALVESIAVMEEACDEVLG